MRPVIVAGLMASLLGGCSRDDGPPLNTVSNFEVERYLGQWHQIATIPAWFQRDCVARTTADYGRAEDGRIRVVNACDTAEGTRKRAEARARFTAAASEGKLEVTFVEVLGVWLWPAAGDYWIIGLDPDYRWSIVGHPSRDYAWVLARSPSLDRQELGEIRDILERAAYDSCALLLTMPERQGRLCDLVT
jgi:apolipoprotein D and lipocalin family protein